MRKTDKLQIGTLSLEIIRTVIAAVISASYFSPVKPIASYICTAGKVQTAIDLISKGWSDSNTFGFYRPFHFYPAHCIGCGWETINNYIKSACATSDRFTEKAKK